jgi:hypothetical protein
MPFGMGPAGWWFLYHPYYRFPFGPPWAPYLSEKDELSFLEEEAKILEKELQAIRKRINELKAKSQSS